MLHDQYMRHHSKQRKKLIRIRVNEEELAELMRENRLLRKTLEHFISFQEIDEVD